MFNKNTKEISKNTKPVNMDRNTIAKNTTIKGEIISEGDFRIDGNLEGDLKTNGRVILGSGGVVTGTIEALNADVEGTFSGQLNVEKILTIKVSANISGDVIVGKLSVEPGATFNASCTMKVTNKELKIAHEKNPKKQQQAKKAYK